MRMMRNVVLSLVACAISGTFHRADAQSPEFMMQGWNWNYPYFYAGIGNQIDYLAAEGPALKEAGFTHIWLPPLAKSRAGSTSMAIMFGIIMISAIMVLPDGAIAKDLRI